MIYRLATESDAAPLAAMRWEYSAEEHTLDEADRETFLTSCAAFIRHGLADGSWHCWLANEADEIVAHVFVRRIAKLPRPGRSPAALGYVTNVYTRPAWRHQGIGSALMAHVIDWARTGNLELLVVWPSEHSVRFYQRAGFSGQNDVMELVLLPD